MARDEQRKSPIPVWEGKEYAKHDRGERMVCAHEIQGPEWVTRFQRWSVRIGFHFMDEPGEVSCFLNLGNRKEAPYVGKRSRYYEAWTLANGGPPNKGDSMSADIFLNKCFLALVEDSTLGADFGENRERNTKPAGEVYSHISELRELVYSPLHPPIRNQESINQESGNHAIKQSTNQGCHRCGHEDAGRILPSKSFSAAPARPRRGFTQNKPKGGMDSIPSRSGQIARGDGEFRDKCARAREESAASDEREQRLP